LRDSWEIIEGFSGDSWEIRGRLLRDSLDNTSNPYLKVAVPLEELQSFAFGFKFKFVSEFRLRIAKFKALITIENS